MGFASFTVFIRAPVVALKWLVETKHQTLVGKAGALGLRCRVV